MRFFLSLMVVIILFASGAGFGVGYFILKSGIPVTGNLSEIPLVIVPLGTIGAAGGSILLLLLKRVVWEDAICSTEQPTPPREILGQTMKWE